MKIIYRLKFHKMLEPCRVLVASCLIIPHSFFYTFFFFFYFFLFLFIFFLFHSVQIHLVHRQEFFSISQYLSQVLHNIFTSSSNSTLSLSVCTIILFHHDDLFSISLFLFGLYTPTHSTSAYLTHTIALQFTTIHITHIHTHIYIIYMQIYFYLYIDIMKICGVDTLHYFTMTTISYVDSFFFFFCYSHSFIYIYITMYICRGIQIHYIE